MGKVDERLKNSIIVELDGELLVWVSGHLTGGQTQVKEMKEWAKLGRAVPLTPFTEPVECVWDDPENYRGALATLLSLNPGRGRIIQAPDSLWEEISDGYLSHHFNQYLEIDESLVREALDRRAAEGADIEHIKQLNNLQEN